MYSTRNLKGAFGDANPNDAESNTSATEKNILEMLRESKKFKKRAGHDFFLPYSSGKRGYKPEHRKPPI